MPHLITLDPHAPPADAMQRAAAVLRKGGLVVFPTETFYGLAADTASPEGLERLALIKGREAEKPFPLILAGREQLSPLVREIPQLAERLMARHWPGPLTLVLAAKPGVHKRLLSQDNGVGVRVSPWEAASGLAQALGRGVTATSANLAGGAPPRRVAELDPELAGAADLVLDGGPTPGGPPSTVLDVRQDPPKILRRGPIDIPEAVFY